MTIDVKPETERLVREEIRNGHFRNVDDLIVRTVHAWREQQKHAPTSSNPSAAESIARIRELRQGLTLGDLSIKDLINEGRP